MKFKPITVNWAKNLWLYIIKARNETYYYDSTKCTLFNCSIIPYIYTYGSIKFSLHIFKVSFCSNEDYYKDSEVVKMRKIRGYGVLG